jgi:hypothetical protein
MQSNLKHIFVQLVDGVPNTMRTQKRTKTALEELLPRKSVSGGGGTVDGKVSNYEQGRLDNKERNNRFLQQINETQALLEQRTVSPGVGCSDYHDASQTDLKLAEQLAEQFEREDRKAEDAAAKKSTRILRSSTSGAGGVGKKMPPRKGRGTGGVGAAPIVGLGAAGNVRLIDNDIGGCGFSGSGPDGTSTTPRAGKYSRIPLRDLTTWYAQQYGVVVAASHEGSQEAGAGTVARGHGVTKDSSSSSSSSSSSGSSSSSSSSKLRPVVIIVEDFDCCDNKVANALLHIFSLYHSQRDVPFQLVLGMATPDSAGHMLGTVCMCVVLLACSTLLLYLECYPMHVGMHA